MVRILPSTHYFGAARPRRFLGQTRSFAYTGALILVASAAMGKLSDLLALAQQRARELGLPYAGALTPAEAHEVARLAPGAKLVDVRTRAELDFVGRIPGAIEIEWQFYPGYAPNTHFLAELKRQADPESLLLFICRSGHRSHRAAAAATEAGFAECYNVLEGFEGDRDAKGQRGKVGGWRAAGLPWQQG
ncbi:rhodanese [Candidatus Desulfobacillus denitrificans]|uniref:Rhodanese n=1 Tax=Candidatus Desulfobacillus denitrificans TaxID=2608985 RepID=A0A809RT45_9PROT|nr:rhodanese [Candidatus Desulfobacillus denitrificans]GIK45695.1 MAG: hypothetical protein BroJett012_15980 [Betaproteobacteria bacterium]